MTVEGTRAEVVPEPSPASGAPAVAPPDPARVGWRELAAAVLGCLAGAALVLFATAATWIRLRVSTVGDADSVARIAAALPVRLTGGAVVPGATGLGLVGLAGVVAIAATRRVGRIVVGLLIFAAGLGVAVLAVRVALDPAGAARRTAQVRQLTPGGGAAGLRDVTATAGPWVGLVGGLLLAASGLLVAARGRRWSALSARHSAPATRPVNAWDSIERGDDPT